jgi:processive 1,2-diacylglycerol beta-glucosyltransferase
MKKVMILTSVKTGFGHKASSNAIEKKLIDRGFETRQIDVFPLMGRLGETMENSYIPLTTKAPFVYYICQRISEYFPWFIHRQMYLRVKENLLKEIRSFQPDLILSVQCMFTRSISHILKENGLPIPFHVGVIDLVDPPKVWEDKEADITYVPTQAIKEKYLRKGFAKEKVIVTGFPTRDDIFVRKEAKTIGDPVRILMINASTDLKKNIAFLEEVARLGKVRIDFVCGLDQRLYETLQERKAEGLLPDHVEIHGFVDNVNEYLRDSHLILTKAGPNIIAEAIRSDTAIVLTGHIHGQENHNYRYVLDHGFGLRCEKPSEIYALLNDFIESGKLKKCLETMIVKRTNNGAERIAEHIAECLR